MQISIEKDGMRSKMGTKSVARGKEKEGRTSQRKHSNQRT